MRLAKKNLNADQKTQVERIRDFQAQAKQVKDEDLASAVSLAKTAETLASLVDRLRSPA